MSASDDFKRQLDAFMAKTRYKTQQVFLNVVADVKHSITDGNPIVGSPGQPVRTGFLRDSWNTTMLSPTEALIATNCEYAAIIEHNLRGAKIPAGPPKGSTVGGSGSVRLTIGGFQRLVDYNVRGVADL